MKYSKETDLNECDLKEILYFIIFETNSQQD